MVILKVDLKAWKLVVCSVVLMEVCLADELVGGLENELVDMKGV